MQLTLRSYFSCSAAWKEKGEHELPPGGFLRGFTRGSDERPAVNPAGDTSSFRSVSSRLWEAVACFLLVGWDLKGIQKFSIGVNSILVPHRSFLGSVRSVVITPKVNSEHAHIPLPLGQSQAGEGPMSGPLACCN